MSATASFVQQACSNVVNQDNPIEAVPAAEAAPPPAQEARGANDGKKLTKAEKKERKSAAKMAKKKGGGAGMIDTEPVKGTRDFPPEDMRLKNWLFGTFKEIARQFAFQEYDAPVLENEDLYKRKAGEEITEQMYNFVDKSGRAVSLRPEMTPSLARLVLKSGKAMRLPIKWFSLPQCWRYENTTRGRRREHYQWNMDIFGEAAVTAEAELLAAVVTFFKSVGITEKDVGIKISSRKVLQCVLEPMGVTSDLFPSVCVIVDKLDKLPREEVEKQLADLGLKAAVADTLIQTLSLKDIGELEAMLSADSPAVLELKELFDYADAYGYREWLQFDASVVRGLAYYTGIVFEGFDRAGELRAICGGGRYDRLLSTFGAKQDIPACGFGFGDCVIVELLKDKNLLPTFPMVTNYVVVPYSLGERAAALGLVAKLRARGLVVDIILGKKKKIGWCYQYADRVGAEKVILVAPDEWARGCVKVKDMSLGKDAADKDLEVKIEDL